MDAKIKKNSISFILQLNGTEEYSQDRKGVSEFPDYNGANVPKTSNKAWVSLGEFAHLP